MQLLHVYSRHETTIWCATSRQYGILTKKKEKEIAQSNFLKSYDDKLLFFLLGLIANHIALIEQHFDLWKLLLLVNGHRNTVASKDKIQKLEVSWLSMRCSKSLMGQSDGYCVLPNGNVASLKTNLYRPTSCFLHTLVRPFFIKFWTLIAMHLKIWIHWHFFSFPYRLLE